MCNNNVKYTSNTSYAVVDTANPNLDGSGTLSTVLTAGLSGCIINQVSIKATGNTQQGMIRLFIDDGTSSFLYTEIRVRASTQTEVEKSYSAVFVTPIRLKNGYSLKASTQEGDTFTVVASGMNMESCGCA